MDEDMTTTLRRLLYMLPGIAVVVAMALPLLEGCYTTGELQPPAPLHSEYREQRPAEPVAE
jgi:hypothetical protein